MKRLHAILLLLRIAACIAVMIGKEVWVYSRKRKGNDRKTKGRRVQA